MCAFKQNTLWCVVQCGFTLLVLTKEWFNLVKHWVAYSVWFSFKGDKIFQLDDNQSLLIYNVARQEEVLLEGFIQENYYYI